MKVHRQTAPRILWLKYEVRMYVRTCSALHVSVQICEPCMLLTMGNSKTENVYSRSLSRGKFRRIKSLR